MYKDTLAVIQSSEVNGAQGYRTSMRLGSRDVNMFRKLRTAAMFELFQELSVVHGDMIGVGTEAVLKKGVVWVVAMQRVDIKRMPSEQELIHLETWTGKTAHLLCPRYYRVYDEQGEAIIDGCAIWSLMDINTRQMVNPDDFGFNLPDMTRGDEPIKPGAPKKAAGEVCSRFTVPYSYLDQNGHMNNTRYFDLCEDLITAPLEGKRLKTVVSRYASEARHGESIELTWQEKDGIYRISGSGEKKYFTINLEYYED